MPGTLKLQFDRYNRPVVTVEVKPGLQYHQQFVTSPPANAVPRTVVKFLVDTGSNECVIDDKEVASWRLPQHFPIVVQSVADPSDPNSPAVRISGYRYELSLKLHESYQQDYWYHGTWPVATVNDNRFDGQDFKGIIGMDLLRHGSLSYVGHTNTFKLSW